MDRDTFNYYSISEMEENTDFTEFPPRPWYNKVRYDRDMSNANSDM